jgi:putative phosphoribosyl transferase
VRTYANRAAAGKALAQHLLHLRGQNVVVLGLPRGGVPVAAETAKALDAPLDVIVVRKLGLPGQPEVAMGALGEDGVRVLNPRIAAYAGPEEVRRVQDEEHAELEQRVAAWRAGRPACRLEGKVAVIVDDGVATGATAAAACDVARLRGAARVVFAAPVGAGDSAHALSAKADEVVVPLLPDTFYAVGQWYADFTPTTDDEVTRLLAEHRPC